MRNIRIAFVLAILSLAVWSAHSDDIAELRAGGQKSVDELAAQLAQAPAAQRADLEVRLDRVCAQKDCASSRLFWYTDLAEAKAAAQRLHRPILALHLLGRLDEELSCANSRFFRTLLYPDDSISSILRGEYVLYWHSVRPVPHVTIEMGDGRVIHQTITGNSAHYLLDENGNVLDALPGLYSPAAFRAQLQEWVALHRSLGGATAEARRAILRSHHARLTAGVDVAEAVAPKPTAINASWRVVSKTSVEAPMLALFQKPTSVPIADLQPLAEWVALGEQHKDEVHFSPAAVELIRRKQFGSADVSEAAMNDLLDTLRRNVAADTALNETTMRPRIHQWFANGEVRDLDSLNERIYRELFLTPNDDPWLGLKPPTVFTAIGGSS
jgi:hypothetical protein